MDLLQNVPIPYYILTPGAHAKKKLTTLTIIYYILTPGAHAWKRLKTFNNCAWDAIAALKSNS